MALMLLAATPAGANAQTDNTPAQQLLSDADAQAFSGVVRRLAAIWHPSCEISGFRDTHPDIRFVIGKDGRLVSGPDWANPQPEAVWQTAAERAKVAVVQGQLYDDLPDGLYNKPLIVTFDARQACN